MTNVNCRTAIARLKRNVDIELILIGNNLPWCRLHTVPTFDGESYGLSIFFRNQWQRLHFSEAFFKGHWKATFLNFWWTVTVGDSWPFVKFLSHEELIVFECQIWNHNSFRSCNLHGYTLILKTIVGENLLISGSSNFNQSTRDSQMHLGVHSLASVPRREIHSVKE